MVIVCSCLLVDWETFYGVFVILVGVVVNAAIIGNIASMAANVEGTKATFEVKADGKAHILPCTYFFVPRRNILFVSSTLVL